ncbi:sce7726 family protein [Shouchella clausii]|uniref:sce7726 family protein n=1 Tax=Shouchella clausii TaxID=79880 RepID=UPI00270859CC|nr:sce7726 family protein [Shouchella clausii]MDO7266246.1 sce7726 family protein [Shouchella clausii]MDO7286839.1 sce7726 family protein [Shouchella clausii]
MRSNNNTILNRFFTRRVLKDLINNEVVSVYNSCINRYVSLPHNNFNNRDFVSAIYQFLNSNYRNEYFYKNTLFNKILIGNHSLNTTVALSEIPVNKSKADFILINGKATVYEIKTQLDTFDRLKCQVMDYYRAFDRVIVLTSEENYDKLELLLRGSTVGINVLTKRNTISVRKKPIVNRDYLDHSTIFKILRKNEFENIIKKFHGFLPETVPVSYYKECMKLFLSIEIDLLYPEVLRELKKRNIGEKEEFKKVVPYELKSLVYFSGFKKQDYEKLYFFLNECWRG